MTTVSASDVLVLGVGNVRLGDESVGVHAAEVARRRLPADIRVLALDAIGPATIAELDGVTHILILDCIDVGREPGTIVWFNADDLSPCATRSVHRFGVADLLVRVGQTTSAPAEAIVLGVQPGCTEAGDHLSADVHAAVPRLVDQAARIVCAWLNGTPTRAEPKPSREPCVDGGSVRLV
jgi:hydrogenase maturation protease